MAGDKGGSGGKIRRLLPTRVAIGSISRRDAWPLGVMEAVDIFRAADGAALREAFIRVT